jgi:hypothetical protein
VILCLAALALVLAAVPALVTVRNLRLLRPPPLARPGRRPRVALLIPARDEEATIGAALAAARASEGVDLEVLVLDDGSRDGTAALVAADAARDPRVRLLRGAEPPPGWSGKAHACAALARAAGAPWLVFQDADVTLAPDALARLVEHLEATGADLVSGVPRQEVGSFGERLLVPLIPVVLLGYLPLWRMRASRDPAYAAACGQLVAVRRDAYERAGGHGAVRASLHDGLTLPRAFRTAGLVTDLADLTGLARCRMFRTTRATLAGLGRNATEGLAHPRVIGPATAALVGGQVLPFALALLLAAAPTLRVASPGALALTLTAAALSLGARAAVTRRSALPLADGLLHPLGVTLLVAVQWAALARAARGHGVRWRGRVYAC